MLLEGWTRDTSPFHEGEKDIQDRTGKRADMERFGRRVIRPYLPEQHREFYAQLPFIAAGSVDEDGRPWASLIFGHPGFMSSPGSDLLQINTDLPQDDPVVHSMGQSKPVGLLGIELQTRRRNRVNGRVSKISHDGIDMQVDQSFGNCPQYIQKRDFTFIAEPGLESPKRSVSQSLSDNDQTLIHQADTFFVSSYVHQDGDGAVNGVDVSHRGGRPGFIRVENNTLTIPDYSGNFHFNTLGNFLLNPVAGLVFIDFETGDMLHLTGHVDIIWDGDESLEHFEGAERAWRFHVTEIIRRPSAAPLRWSLTEASPNTALTGTWDDADAQAKAAQNRESWHDYKVVRIEDESRFIRSFYLKRADGTALLTPEAGQFLPIKIPAQNGRKSEVRTYTLSSAPHDPFYRISVKREDSRGEIPAGHVSTWLHKHLKPGDLIKAKAPRGLFTLKLDNERPLLLLAGGVGVTPMISMARHLMVDAFKKRRSHEMTIFHAVNNPSERAFTEEFKALATHSGGALRYIPVTHKDPAPDDIPGLITPDILRARLTLADYEVYLCGPPPFMQALYDALRGLGITDHRINTEAFGPASLKRTNDTAHPSTEESASEALIEFSDSKFEQPWTPQDGSLLDLAESHGLSPEFGCRNGACGSCSVKLLKGQVHYTKKPAAQVEKGEILLCCAVPAKDNETITLAL